MWLLIVRYCYNSIPDRHGPHIQTSRSSVMGLWLWPPFAIIIASKFSKIPDTLYINYKPTPRGIGRGWVPGGKVGFINFSRGPNTPCSWRFIRLETVIIASSAPLILPIWSEQWRCPLAILTSTYPHIRLIHTNTTRCRFVGFPNCNGSPIK